MTRVGHRGFVITSMKEFEVVEDGPQGVPGKSIDPFFYLAITTVLFHHKSKSLWGGNSEVFIIY